ncbi:FtsW/RodA/SpoVE family cell cycle protein [Anaerocolumna xylanovorans]|uniref:Cell division protein FtsW, lipid II flippase n=1 Tax=Anaerocolumna xylanovorans DSM 12503 TaxID=1121345 RepID=A0A1M7XWK8_9FIRM|nr:FtsW/RodA/SpoVE family cell cycle protein [Anaerocolumna xylanovorans]SHO43161.1 cell division protein FtsW, lipid II flippase [Anaerocolumna xylanovorans DSM 12503]
MQPFEEIKKYSKTVCEQIRWKKAHSMIAEEIENHICDQRDAYISEGEEEETATRNAITQMGDAVTVGMELDKTHKSKPQWVLISLTIILMLIGAGVSYLTNTFWNSPGSFHIFPFIVALAAFLITYFLDFSVLGKYPKQCYLLTLVIGMLGLMLSSQINGRAWFVWAGNSVSLAYLSLLFPLTYSLFIYTMRNKGARGIIFCGIAYIPYAIILLLIPTATGFVLYTLTALILLCAAIARGWFGVSKKLGMLFVLFPAGCAAALSCVWCVFNAYRISRISILLHPYSDPKGYQTILIRELMSNAAFTGKGTIPQKYGENPLSMSFFGTDFALTALTHHYGWIAFLGVVMIFTVFSILGFHYVSKQRSVLGLMVSLSILLTFVMQAAIYIIDNLGYGLLSALSLPLVSYGKAALLINSGLIGFMLSVFRTGDIVKDGYKPYKKPGSFIVYEDGKLIIDLTMRKTYKEN